MIRDFVLYLWKFPTAQSTALQKDRSTSRNISPILSMYCENRRKLRLRGQGCHIKKITTRAHVFSNLVGNLSDVEETLTIGSLPVPKDSDSHAVFYIDTPLLCTLS
jgi:hypothetical protein